MIPKVRIRTDGIKAQKIDIPICFLKYECQETQQQAGIDIAMAITNANRSPVFGMSAYHPKIMIHGIESIPNTLPIIIIVSDTFLGIFI